MSWTSSKGLILVARVLQPALNMIYGAKIVAQALHDLGVRVIFGTPGLPVTDIAQQGLFLGIRFISFRNEQAAAYAASAYGYLTGKPGVCISVGGPGVFHVMAGVRLRKLLSPVCMS